MNVSTFRRENKGNNVSIFGKSGGSNVSVFGKKGGNNVGVLARSGWGVSTLIQKLGTLVDPASGDSTIPTTTHFINNSCPNISKLTTLKIYATQIGNCNVRILEPTKSDGFSMIYNQTHALSVGLNTLTLNIDVPAKSLIGVATPSGQALISLTSTAGDTVPFKDGYFTASASLFPTQNLLSGYNYQGELKIQATLENITRTITNQYHLDVDFVNNIVPAYVRKTGNWIVSGGKARASTTSLAEYMQFIKAIDGNRNTFDVETEFTTSGDIFAIGRKPFIQATYGTLFTIDVANNKISARNSWDGNSTLPAINTEKTLTGITLTTGVRYKVSFIKANKNLTCRVTNIATSAYDELTINCYPNYNMGTGKGVPTVSVLAGTVDVYSLKYYSSVISPKTLYAGDSITEGSGVAQGEAWTELCEAYSNNCWISGHGGTTTADILRRINYNYSEILPKYQVVLAGANDSVSDGARIAWESQITRLYDLVVSKGSTPIICCLTPSNDATRNARIILMNQYLLSLPRHWKLVRFDLATTLNNDGQTYNPALFLDGLHTNAAGNIAQYNRILLDAPEIF